MWDEFGTISRVWITFGTFIFSSSPQAAAKASFNTWRRVSQNSSLVDEPLSRTVLECPKASKRRNRKKWRGAEAEHSSFDVTSKLSEEWLPISVLCPVTPAADDCMIAKATTAKRIIDTDWWNGCWAWREPRMLTGEEQYIMEAMTARVVFCSEQTMKHFISGRRSSLKSYRRGFSSSRVRIETTGILYPLFFLLFLDEKGKLDSCPRTSFWFFVWWQSAKVVGTKITRPKKVGHNMVCTITTALPYIPYLKKVWYDTLVR